MAEFGAFFEFWFEFSCEFCAFCFELKFACAFWLEFKFEFKAFFCELWLEFVEFKAEFCAILLSKYFKKLAGYFGFVKVLCPFVCLFFILLP